MAQAQETVVLQGHIIDSLILAKVLDTILMMGGTFDLTDVKIGATREEPSHARIVVRAASGRLLAEILEAIQPHGASVERESDCPLEPAPAALQQKGGVAEQGAEGRQENDGAQHHRGIRYNMRTMNPKSRTTTVAKTSVKVGIRAPPSGPAQRDGQPRGGRWFPGTDTG